MPTDWDKWSEYAALCGVPVAKITKDGIADMASFTSAPRRVLFVLKEPNDSPGTDMRVQLRKGATHPIWHTVGRWAHGVVHGFPPYHETDSRRVKADALRQIAALNLKKVSGGSRSDSDTIGAYAQRTQDLLREQIESIESHVIVACGTFASLVWLLNLNVNVGTFGKVAVKHSTMGAWVVPWRHPARSHGKRDYQGLRDRLASVL